MKKLGKILILAIILFVSYTPLVFARVTIKETLDGNDGFSTIERNTTIIGVTKFSSNEVITASKATTAGSNDAMLYVEDNGTTKGYKAPVIYVYYGPVGGWYALDEDNKAVAVVEEEKLKELSNLEIYYVNNVEKELTIDYDGPEIDISKLEEGVEYKDNKLKVKATTKKIKIPTKDGRNITYKIDSTTSSLVKDDSECYIVDNGYIASYKDTCDSDVIIPTTINNTNIVGISDEAFYNKNITSVVIPKEIKSIGNNAFASNNLKSVVINEKYSKDDFELFGENAFGEFNNVKYNNDVTRSLDLIPDSFDINFYKTIDISNLEDFRYFVLNYLEDNNVKLLEKNGYDFANNEYIVTNRTDKLRLIINYIEDISSEKQKYEISVYKYLLSQEKEIIQKKEIIVNYNKGNVGTENEYNSVMEAVNNIKENQFLKQNEDLSAKLFVSKNNLLELEDTYNVSFYEDYRKGGEVETEEYIYGVGFGSIYVFKNNTLYHILNDTGSMDMAGLIEFFSFKEGSVSNYTDDDDLVKKIINKLKELVGINEYKLIPVENDLLYKVDMMGTKKVYTIYLLDIDSQFQWAINYNEYSDNKYDNKGNTLESCFNISNGVITNYDGTCGRDLVIPDVINGQVVTEIGDNVFDTYDINSIKLPDTITKIGSRAFSNNNLEEVKLPSNLVEIDDEAFGYNLINNIEFNSKLKRIGEHAFSGNKLNELVLPDSLIDIGSYAFLSNEIIGVEFGSKLEIIGDNAFCYNKIKNLTLPNNIKTIKGGAFSNNLIEEVVLSNSLEIIEPSTFQNNLIKEVIIPENVKEIDFLAFSNNKITNLVIPDNVESIEWEAFSDNEISSLDISENVLYIAMGAFNNNKLTGNDAFIYERYYETSYVDGMEVIEVKVNKEKIVSYGGIEKDVVIPDNVTMIGNEAFSNCELNSVIIPNSVDTIESNAFYNNNLTKIAIPKSVINFGSSVFCGNKFKDKYLYYTEDDGSIDYTSLVAYVGEDYSEEIIIPQNVKIIKEYAFSNGSGILTYIPDNVEVIEDGAFGSLNIEKEITLPKTLKEVGRNIFNTYSMNQEEKFVYARNKDGSIDKTVLMAYVGYVDNYFCGENGCFRDEDFIFELPEQVVEIRENVFSLNINVDTIKLNKNLKKIGEDAFSCNYQLKNIHFNEGLEEIGDNSFKFNSNIENITLPSTVKKIGNSAFEYNSNLTNVTLNEGLEEVGDDAFGYNQLTEIDIPSTVKKIGTNSFGYNIQKVRIHGKSSLDEFESIGDNPFGFNIYDDDIEYIN